jgi:hypothetical protein
MPKFQIGDRVRKTKGSSWQGRVVGTYQTTLTPEGYCVESEREPGSVQIYPAAALESVAERVCPECNGAGELGGQFCGGDFHDCERCGGAGVLPRR